VTVFGYITASLASMFITHDQEKDNSEILGRVDQKIDTVLAALSKPTDNNDQLH
jgi:hypothetical protein